MTPIPTRFTDDEVTLMDVLVDKGLGETRSDVIRRALHELADRQRRQGIGEQAVRAYTAVPPTDEETDWAIAASRALGEADV